MATDYKALAPLNLTRKELIEANAPAIKELVLKHHKPEEAIAKLDYIKKLLTEVDHLIREDLVKEMDGSYELLAYDKYIVFRAKCPANWEYFSDPVRAELINKAEDAKRELKEYEDKMKKEGRAIDQNENKYTIKIREIKND